MPPRRLLPAVLALVVIVTSVVAAGPSLAAPSPGGSADPLRGVVDLTALAVDIRPDADSVPRVDIPEATLDPAAIIGASAWHGAGALGAGIRIGVIDFFEVNRHWDVAQMGPTPVAGVTARCISLGQDCTATFFDGVDDGGDDHGPAVVEVIRDVAPQAEIFIGRATTSFDYLALIDWFAANGVRVISRSLGGRYDGPGDGRGLLDAAADHAVSKGIMWVNSGGNNAQFRYYRQPVRLVDRDVAFGPTGTDTWLRFRSCAEPAGVRWANDWDLPAAQRTDYDAYIYESPTGNPAAGTVVAKSEARQRVGLPPLESFSGERCPGPGNSLYLRITLRSGVPDGDVLEVLDYSGGFDAYGQAAYSATTPIVASKNPGVLAVGAIDPPTSGSVGAYSSQGPTNDGRVKPDVMGPSGIANTTFDGRFSGTSASAPVIAGAAALLMSVGAATGPREYADLIRNSTIDRGAPGQDMAYGWGEFRMPAIPTGIDATPSRFVAFDPIRVLDTRTTSPIGPPGSAGRTLPGEIIRIPVGGLLGSPVTAVAINLTMVDAGTSGYTQVLPTGSAVLGGYSNSNIDTARQTRPNFAIVPVGRDGTISVYHDIGGEVLVDVMGAFTPSGATAGGRFVGLATPNRVLDTRAQAGAPKAINGQVVRVPLPSGLPAADVAALVVNVTATDVDGFGYVQALPAGRSDLIGLTSTLNVEPGDTMANTAIVPVGAGGLELYTEFRLGGAAHLIVDVTGYVTTSAAPVATSGRFVPVTPNRRFDSRQTGGPLLDDQVVDVATGAGAGATGVVLNLTATGTTRYGFVTAWSPDAPEPSTSALNFARPGMTIANAAAVRPDGAGTTRVRATDQSGATSGALTHLIVDVFGWFT